MKTGASKAKPMVMEKMPAKLTTKPCPELAEKLRVGTANSTPPRIIPIAPASAVNGTSRRAVSSRPDRVSAWRGETVVASQAGSAAAATVANTPASAPLARLATGSAIPRTVTTKYRSLMVCVTACTAPWPRITPSPRPSSEPSAPTITASPNTRTPISPRVTPRQRNVPKSGRRCTTEKVMLL